jgi:arsenate reductase
MKKVLILCTGNSCRSIIAEALINAKLDRCIEAYSSGVKASGRVNPHAKELLQEHDMWRDEYHSKTIDKVMDQTFEDPDGKGPDAFVQTMMEIETQLLPIVEKELCS